MTDSRILPGARARLVNPDGTTARDFYVFFRQLEQAGVSESLIRELAIKLGSPDGSIANIPDNPGGIQSIIGQAPINASGNVVSLLPLVPAVGGELFGITVDAYGRVSEARPVVAGAGITIDGTTDPTKIEISSTATGSTVTNRITTDGDFRRTTQNDLRITA